MISSDIERSGCPFQSPYPEIISERYIIIYVSAFENENAALKSGAPIVHSLPKWRLCGM